MLQGDVDNLPLPALLQGLISHHNSGILTLESHSQSRRIGVSAAGLELISDDDGHSGSLEEILAALEILQPAEITNILSHLPDAAPGDALLRLRLLDTAIVTGPIRALLQEKLLDVFGWQKANYRFEICHWQESRLFTGEGVAPSLRFPIPTLLLEVARREDEKHLNQVTGVDPEEIYIPSSESDTLDQVIQKTIAIEPIQQKFSRLLQQSMPLKDVIEISRAPAALALESTRRLLQKNAIEPMPAREKKVLADQFLSQRRRSRAVSVLLSLVSQEEDLSSLEMLNTLLQQEKAPTSQREQILLKLARVRNEHDDSIGCRKALRQRADLLPENIDALLDLLESLPRRNSRRESAKLLEKIYKNVQTKAEAIRVAEAIESVHGGQPIRDPQWLERSVLLRIHGQDEQGASQLIESLLEDAHRAGKERTDQKKWLLLLEKCNPDAHQKWQSRIERFKKSSSWKSGVLALLFLTCGLSILLRDQDTKKQAAALAPNLTTTGIATTEAPLESRSDQNSDLAGEHLAETERGFSQAVRLHGAGKYLEALHQLNSLRTEKTPTATNKTIEKFRRDIETYIEKSQRLSDQVQDLKNRQEFDSALELQFELIRQYPHSPAVTGLKIELPLDLTPRQATVWINDELVTPKNNASGLLSVAIPADHPVLIKAQSPGHESQTLWHEPGSKSRLQLHLSRQPILIVAGESSIRASHTTAQGSVITIDKDSTIRSIVADRSETLWEITPAKTGDLLPEILPLKDSILVATSSGHLFRIDTSDGSISKETRISSGTGIFRTAPIEVAGKILISTSRGLIHALDPESLEVNWQRKIKQIRNYPLHVAGDHVVAVGPKTVTVIDPEGGVTLWEKELPKRPLACAARKSALFIATSSGITRYSVSDGKPVWQIELEKTTTHSLTTSSDLLIQLTTDGALRGIDLTTGIIRWTTGNSTSEVSVSATGSHLFAYGDATKKLHVIDLRNGQRLWTHDGSSNGISIAIEGQKLLLGNETGDLLLFETSPVRPDLSASENSS